MHPDTKNPPSPYLPNTKGKRKTAETNISLYTGIFFTKMEISLTSNEGMKDLVYIYLRDLHFEQRGFLVVPTRR